MPLPLPADVLHGALQALIWQLDFAVPPETLQDINYQLRVDEEVLRWVVKKRELMPPLPSPRAMYHRHPVNGPLLRPPAMPATPLYPPQQ